MWTGRAESHAFLVGAGVTLVTGLVLAAIGQWWIAALLLVVAVALALFTSATVVIDDEGLRVHTTWCPLVGVRFPLGEIVGVEAIDLRPSRWGGWGYRGSVRVFKRAAWILRAGPGIKLDLAGGRRFVVSVDDAADGAAALQARLVPR